MAKQAKSVTRAPKNLRQLLIGVITASEDILDCDKANIETYLAQTADITVTRPRASSVVMPFVTLLEDNEYECPAGLRLVQHIDDAGTRTGPCIHAYWTYKYRVLPDIKVTMHFGRAP